jgi:hypothetical protein
LIIGRIVRLTSRSYVISASIASETRTEAISEVMKKKARAAFRRQYRSAVDAFLSGADRLLQSAFDYTHASGPTSPTGQKSVSPAELTAYVDEFPAAAELLERLVRETRDAAFDVEAAAYAWADGHSIPDDDWLCVPCGVTKKAPSSAASNSAVTQGDSGLQSTCVTLDPTTGAPLGCCAANEKAMDEKARSLRDVYNAMISGSVE